MADLLPAILWISPHPPYPPTSGASLRTLNLVEQIASHCRITLLAPPPGASEAALAVRHIARLRAAGVSLIVQRFPPESAGEGLPLGLSFGPLTSWEPCMLRIARGLRPDVVVLKHVCHIESLAQVRLAVPEALFVLDAHDVETLHLEQRLARITSSRSSYETALARAHALECSLGRWVDGLFACSRHDLAWLQDRNPGLLGTVVPNGIVPMSETIPPPSSPPRLIFAGSLHFELVEEGLAWFFDAVWPRLRASHPELTIDIVGNRPGPFLLELAARQPGVLLSASVPDLRPYYARAWASVCPLLSGSGTRLKILEAMNLGIPVVSTSVGAEGIEAVAGRDILIADDPESFATAVVAVLEDRSRARALAICAAALVREHYDWRNIAKQTVAWLGQQVVQRRQP